MYYCLPSFMFCDVVYIFVEFGREEGLDHMIIHIPNCLLLHAMRSTECSLLLDFLPKPLAGTLCSQA